MEGGFQSLVEVVTSMFQSGEGFKVAVNLYPVMEGRLQSLSEFVPCRYRTLLLR